MQASTFLCLHMHTHVMKMQLISALQASALKVTVVLPGVLG